MGGLTYLSRWETQNTYLHTIKLWNNLHSSPFPLLHLWKILHKFQATFGSWFSLFSPFPVSYLPYDILEAGVRDLIQCSTVHHSTWQDRECSSNIVSINLLTLASTWQFQQPGVKAPRLFNWCQRSLSQLYSKFLTSFPPNRVKCKAPQKKDKTMALILLWEDFNVRIL